MNLNFDSILGYTWNFVCLCCVALCYVVLFVCLFGWFRLFVSLVLCWIVCFVSCVCLCLRFVGKSLICSRVENQAQLTCE